MPAGTAKPDFESPAEPRRFGEVMRALEVDKRFADQHEMLGFLAKIATHEYHSGEHERVMLAHVALLELFETERTMSRGYREMWAKVDWMYEFARDSHNETLKSDRDRANQELEAHPGILYVQSSNGIDQKITRVDTAEYDDFRMPNTLVAYCGDLLVAHQAKALLCDVAALPTDAMRQAVREYDR